MNCHSAQEIFPALLDQRTAATDHLDARAHLANCPDCQREFAALSQTLASLDAMPTPTPSPRLRKNFYAMLEEEKHSAASVRAVARREHRTSVFRWILAPAGLCAVLLVGFFAGTRFNGAATPAANPDTVAMRAELRTLRDQVQKNNLLLARSIIDNQQNPTNERLNQVLAAAKSDNPQEKDLADLVDAVAFDPSTNVRLRALEALYQHADREKVRNGVRAALGREQSPLVQLEMIDFVATAHDREATPVLEKMSQNEQLDRAVRDAAARALTQL
jgi:anti-sigma factor RsiW